MDQLVGALGRAGHALLIDCRSLDVTEVKIPDFSAKIVVYDTHVKHEHAASGYNRRREECQESVEVLKRSGFAIQSLRDVTVETLDEALKLLPEPLNRRVRHVVRENARTSAAVDALKRSHLPGLGRLMNGSHASLRDDYEVSAPELDFMVDTLQRAEGVLGARMVGGGFGGSVVALIKSEAVSAVTASLVPTFKARFRVEPSATITTAGDGMREEIVARA
jgi:galactokinase